MNYVEVESTNFLKELTEVTFNLEAESMYTFKGIEYYWLNEKNCSKIPQALCSWAHFTSFFQVHI